MFGNSVDSIIKPVTKAITKLRKLADQNEARAEDLSMQIAKTVAQRTMVNAERTRALTLAARLEQQFGVK